MIHIKVNGDFSKTKSFLERSLELLKLGYLDRYGERGVQALTSATPVDTGKTADSWYYEIRRNSNTVSIIWKNSNINKGIPIAILLQYGHGTRNGGYVKGRDYINPAIRPIFDDIANELGKEMAAL